MKIRPNTDWSKYAENYDHFQAVNPAYCELISTMIELVAASVPERNSVILDVGAGTGNLSIAVARAHPESQIIHIEPDAAMRRRAEQKAGEADLKNWASDSRTWSEAEYESVADIVVSTHALYVMPDSIGALEKIACALKPQGRAILVDIGVRLNINEWRRYLLKSYMENLGFLKTAALLAKSKDFTNTNRDIADKQSTGVYWTHTPEEFAASTEKVGLRVLHAKSTYRGYSSMCVAERPS